MSIAIVLVDNHGITREGLRLLIERQEDMEVVGEAADGREAVRLANNLEPNLVIMDVSLPGLNGVDAARQIIKANPEVKVLALSAYANKRFVIDMLTVGALGYVLKDGMAGELVRAIHAVMNGERYLSTKVAGIVIDNYINNGEDGNGKPSLNMLTPKERELLQLLVEGNLSKSAARLLSISIKTVDARRRDIMNKLRMSSLADLTKFAIREGLTTVDF